jgi:hypothetical protein
LSGEPVVLEALRLFGAGCVSSAGASDARLPAACRFREDLGCGSGVLEGSSSLETTNVTPYRAPRTRTASSRGSLESIVIFKVLPFDLFTMAHCHD